ncbi:MAG: hypothetical protein IJU87_03275 [Lachnospiraceae bacterium]|nr:hypothetical protein [Lachnospiraceae bacterium]
MDYSESSSSIIKKNILSNYPGAVFYGLLFNVTLMIDSIIAGQSLGERGIAAVALGTPGYGVPAAIIYSFIHGSGLRMIWARGRTDNPGCQRAFREGATLVAVSGLIVAVLIYALSYDIVLLCGGNMVAPDLRRDALIYLQFCSPIVFFTALGMILQEIMNVYGFQTERAALSAVNISVNLIVSIFSVSSLPADMKLAGLGLGTSAGGLMEFIIGIILLRSKDLNLKYRPLIPASREIRETFRYGFPAAADYFAESIVMGLQNNLILSGFNGDAVILSTSEVVCNISYFASGAIKGAALATEPLFGVFYEERDISSIRKVWRQGWITGTVMSVIFAVLFLLSLPLLSLLFGMKVTQDIQRGMFFCMIFAPVMNTVYMFTLYYEAVRRLSVSIAFAIIPDSCLYILMMAFLIPVLGKDGIWLAITGNQLIGLILLVPSVFLISKGPGKGIDRLLLLSDEFFPGKLLIEFEILKTGTGITADLESLREPLKRAVSDPRKTDITMQGLKDLVSDMLRSSDDIHIKLREGDEKTEIYLRSLGEQYGTPTGWRGAGALSYSYVYKMNIVRITLQ